MARFPRLALPLALVCGLGACTQSEKEQDASGLRSDLPLRDTQYLIAHRPELQTVNSVCAAWKQSQRPVGSWPSVIVSNCNNAEGANEYIRSTEQRAKFRKDMGI